MAAIATTITIITITITAEQITMLTKRPAGAGLFLFVGCHRGMARPQMRDCASGNLEIPRFRAPRNDGDCRKSGMDTDVVS
jgi:hypothetical protein